MSIREQDLATTTTLSDDEDNGVTTSGITSSVGTDPDDKTPHQKGLGTDSPASSRRQLSFFGTSSPPLSSLRSSIPDTPYIGRISPDAGYTNSISAAPTAGTLRAYGEDALAGTVLCFESPTPAASAVGDALRTRGDDAAHVGSALCFESPTSAASRAGAPRIRGKHTACAAGAAGTGGEGPKVPAEYPEISLIKAVIGEDIKYSTLSVPTPIAHTIYPSFLDQQFRSRLADLATSAIEGAALVKSLNDIIGLNISEDVLTEDLKARLLYNNIPAFLAFRSLVPLTPPKRGQLEKGKADSEIDTILLFESDGRYFSLVISCKSDYTRGRIGDEIKHLKKWTDLGFSVQLETGIKSEVLPEVFPIKAMVMKQYPALDLLVKSEPRTESIPMLLTLLSAAKPRWIKAVLSPNPDEHNSIPADAIRTDTVLGPRLIEVLLVLSSYRELHETISALIKKLPEEYHRGITDRYLPNYPTPVFRSLLQEIETCSALLSIEKKSSELTKIARHMNHLLHLLELARRNNQPELAACISLRLNTSLRNIPIVAQEMQRLQDEMAAEKRELFATEEKPVAGLAGPGDGILTFGRRSRTSSMQASGAAAAASAGNPVAMQLESTAAGGVFHAYAPATGAGATVTATSATSAVAVDTVTVFGC